MIYRRGTFATKRHRRWCWYWKVCLGGSTWTEPEHHFGPKRWIVRKAARRLYATPNRENRRGIAVLNRGAADA